VLAASKHTLLVREGVWRMEGEYTDPDHTVCCIDGETATRHGSKSTIVTGYIRLQSMYPGEFHFTSEMPFDHPQEFVSWKCNVLFAGTMEGRLYVFTDHMVLQYNSSNGEFSGMENLLRINDIFYQSAGVIFRAKEKFTSWKMDLIRMR
jgi:hypothetical protein